MCLLHEVTLLNSNLTQKLFTIWNPALPCTAFFFLASSCRHPPMNFHYSFLLLLVVLSAYSEGPQYVKPPDSVDSTLVTVCPDSSSISLGVLTPILPQNEEFKFVLPQNEVYISVLPQNEVFV